MIYYFIWMSQRFVIWIPPPLSKYEGKPLPDPILLFYLEVTTFFYLDVTIPFILWRRTTTGPAIIFLFGDFFNPMTGLFTYLYSPQCHETSICTCFLSISMSRNINIYMLFGCRSRCKLQPKLKLPIQLGCRSRCKLQPKLKLPIQQGQLPSCTDCGTSLFTCFYAPRCHETSIFTCFLAAAAGASSSQN